MFEKSGSPLNAFKPSSRLSTKLLKNSNASCCSRKFTGSPHSLGDKVPVITSRKPWASPVPVIRNLVSWFDSQLTMPSHISKLCSVAFYHLYNIWRIRKHLSQEAAGTLVQAFITSQIDHCNSLLYGLPNSQLWKIQRVLNASARLVCNAPRFRHITPIMRDLHWLHINLDVLKRDVICIYSPFYIILLLNIYQLVSTIFCIF